jgi:hypothetical protein
MSDELREKLKRIHEQAESDHFDYPEAFVDAVLVVTDSAYSGLDAVRECPNCNGHGQFFSGSEIPCHTCKNGTIRRKLTNKEALEWAKKVAIGGSIVLDYGERVVVGGE